ncbi:MAG: ABC transporter permease [Verrucomicrobia bacterium]|nr:ABC transporter permease [Verrucomicrobiota bacterium]
MRSLFRYKDIIYYRTLAGLKSEARKNYLGYVWFLLEPLMSTGVLYFAMSHLTGQKGASALMTILLGMITWQWLEGSVMLSAGSIAAKFHVHQQVPLPKYLFPLVDIGANTIRFAFAFVIVLAACFSAGFQPGPTLLWLPVLLGLQLALIIGLSLIVSIGVTLVSDLHLLLQSLFRLLFFVSGIFFTAERVPAHLLPYFYANPMAVLIESYRAVILGGRAPDFPQLGTVAATAGALLLTGSLIQAYFDKRLLKLTNV